MVGIWAFTRRLGAALVHHVVRVKAAALLYSEAVRVHVACTMESNLTRIIPSPPVFEPDECGLECVPGSPALALR